MGLRRSAPQFRGPPQGRPMANASSSLNDSQRAALKLLSTSTTPVLHRSGAAPKNPHHKTLGALVDLGYASQKGEGYVVTTAGKAALTA
jgi:hypothetical protein